MGADECKCGEMERGHHRGQDHAELCREVQELPDYSSKGRASAAMDAKHGGDLTRDLFQGMVPALADMSSLPQCQTFQSTAWLAGYAPEMRFVGLQVNGCATLKAGVLGEVLRVCISVSDLVAGLEHIGKLTAETKFPNVDAFCNVLETLDMDAFEKMQANGSKIYARKLLPCQVLCVPMGWFCCELAISGTVIVCAWQGFFMQANSQEDLKQYQGMRDLLACCAKTTDRYDEVLALLSKLQGQQ